MTRLLFGCCGGDESKFVVCCCCCCNSGCGGGGGRDCGRTKLLVAGGGGGGLNAWVSYSCNSVNAEEEVIQRRLLDSWAQKKTCGGGE